MPAISNKTPPVQCISLNKPPRMTSELAKGLKILRELIAHLGVSFAFRIKVCLKKRERINQINRHKLGASL